MSSSPYMNEYPILDPPSLHENFYIDLGYEIAFLINTRCNLKGQYRLGNYTLFYLKWFTKYENCKHSIKICIPSSS